MMTHLQMDSDKPAAASSSQAAVTTSNPSPLASILNKESPTSTSPGITAVSANKRAAKYEIETLFRVAPI